MTLSPNNRPALSIIIPALNEAEGIGQTLERLQPMRERGSQVILVDGNSSDDTLRIASPLVDRVITAPPGRAGQMRAGLGEARGAVLWFLHADTLAPVDADIAIQQALADGRSGWGRFDVRLDGRHPLFRLIERMMNLRSRLTGICTGDQGIFVTKGILEKAGGLPDQPLMEDIELSKRLKRHTRPCCLKQTLVTSSRRWEARGILRTVLLMWSLRGAYALGADPRSLAGIYR